MSERKEKIKNVVRQLLMEILTTETGPSAQGIIQPWLGPSIRDDNGIPPRDGDFPNLQPQKASPFSKKNEQG